MNILATIFSVLFGLAFGSFLNVCISRLPRGESVISPGSHCPECGAAVRPVDNVPLLSWLILRGRCRSCCAGIPVRYFLIELSTAALFLLCILRFGLNSRGIGAAVLCFLLIGLAAMDAETMLLPDAFTLPGMGVGLLYTGLLAPAYATHLLPSRPHLSAVLFSATCAGVAGGVILLIRWLYWLVRREEGMGLGDAKLFALIAAWQGPAETVLVFFLAVVTGAAYGLILIGIGRSRSRAKRPLPTRVPLGAFLCLSSIYALFLGEQTLRLYLGLFT